MNQLVFLDPDKIDAVPFTTSEVIAQYGEVKHHAVRVMIQKFEDDLNDFGKLSFEMRPLPSGQSEKIYKLNQEQATLLITYMKNTLPVRRFKKALVKQFYVMHKELTKRAVTRIKAKEAREALTNAIQGLPESPHKQMKYKHYTDLAYKVVFGKTSKQLRGEYGIGQKENLRDYFTAEENEMVEKVERQISVLIDLGNDYKTIKLALEKRYIA